VATVAPYRVVSVTVPGPDGDIPAGSGPPPQLPYHGRKPRALMDTGAAIGGLGSELPDEVMSKKVMVIDLG
jgi:hypothetical protein